MTTNLSFKHWGRIFNNDNTVAAAVVDRLLHHAEIFTIDGKSYRTQNNNPQQMGET